MRTSGLVALAASAMVLTACSTATTTPTPTSTGSGSPTNGATATPPPASSPSAPLTVKEPNPPKFTPSDTSQPTMEPGPVGKTVRGIVSAGGAAKGPLETVSTALPDEAAVEAYASRLAPSLSKQVIAEAQRLMRQVPEGQYLHAQTVYDGCDTPDPATITAKPTSGGVALLVKKPLDTNKQCFTAERSVAFLSVGTMAG